MASNENYTNDAYLAIQKLGGEFQCLHAKEEFEDLMRQLRESTKEHQYDAYTQSIYTNLINVLTGALLPPFDFDNLPDRLNERNVDAVMDKLNELAENLQSQKEIDARFTEELYKIYAEMKVYKKSADYMRRLVINRLSKISPELICSGDEDSIDLSGEKSDNVKDDIPTELLIFKQFLKQFGWCEGIPDDNHGRGFDSVRIRRMCLSYVLGNSVLNRLREALGFSTEHWIDVDDTFCYCNYLNLAEEIGSKALHGTGFKIIKVSENDKGYFNTDTISKDFGESLFEILLVCDAGHDENDDDIIKSIENAIISEISPVLKMSVDFRSDGELIFVDKSKRNSTKSEVEICKDGNTARFSKIVKDSVVYKASFSLENVESESQTSLAAVLAKRIGSLFMNSLEKIAQILSQDDVDLKITREKIEYVSRMVDMKTFQLLCSQFTKLQVKKNNDALIRIAKNMGRGFFQKKENNREPLYVFAIAFDMTVSLSHKLPDVSSEEYFTDIEKNLFFDFYTDNLINSLLRNGDSEKDITGYGVNYKNFLEAAYIYGIATEKTAFEKFKMAKQIINTCLSSKEKKSANQIDEYYETNYEWAPDRTIVYRENLALHMSDSPREFCNYLLSDYVLRYESEEAFFKQIHAYDFGSDLRTACYFYEDFTKSNIRNELTDDKVLTPFLNPLDVNPTMTSDEKKSIEKFNSIINAVDELIRREKIILNYDQGLKGDCYNVFQYREIRDAYGLKKLCRSDLIIAALNYIIIKALDSAGGELESQLSNFSKFYDYVANDYYFEFNDIIHLRADGLNQVLEQCGFMVINPKSIIDLILMYAAYRQITALKHLF